MTTSYVGHWDISPHFELTSPPLELVCNIPSSIRSPDSPSSIPLFTLQCPQGSSRHLVFRVSLRTIVYTVYGKNIVNEQQGVAAPPKGPCGLAVYDLQQWLQGHFSSSAVCLVNPYVHNNITAGCKQLVENRSHQFIYCCRTN